MTSNRKIAANQRNSRNARGPRSAAGKLASRVNATTHGLSASVLREHPPSAAIEAFAWALCGAAAGPALFAHAVKIAERRMELRAIRAHQATVLERWRDGVAEQSSSNHCVLDVIDGKTLELPGTQSEGEGREEHEPLKTVAPDLTTLERYERRAWSRLKRAIREFMTTKALQQMVQPESAAAR
jgi:hypothetical protein